MRQIEQDISSVIVITSGQKSHVSQYHNCVSLWCSSVEHRNSFCSLKHSMILLHDDAGRAVCPSRSMKDFILHCWIVHTQATRKKTVHQVHRYPVIRVTEHVVQSTTHCWSGLVSVFVRYALMAYCHCAKLNPVNKVQLNTIKVWFTSTTHNAIDCVDVYL